VPTSGHHACTQSPTGGHHACTQSPTSGHHACSKSSKPFLLCRSEPHVPAPWHILNCFRRFQVGSQGLSVDRADACTHAAAAEASQCHSTLRRTRRCSCAAINLPPTLFSSTSSSILCLTGTLLSAYSSLIAGYILLKEEDIQSFEDVTRMKKATSIPVTRATIYSYFQVSYICLASAVSLGHAHESSCLSLCDAKEDSAVHKQGY